MTFPVLLGSRARRRGGYTPGSQTLSYTGAAQTFTVPAGVTSLTVDMSGAAGGVISGTAAQGARVQATLPVTAGESLQINVGGAGIYHNSSGSVPAGGFNGGGDGGLCHAGERSWSGGGASDIRQGGTALGNRVLVAGGGGGGLGPYGTGSQDWGGAGGGTTGEAGHDSTAPNAGTSGGGGTPSAGGAAGTSAGGGVTAGSSGQGGHGGTTDGAGGGPDAGGGGGGGYYGGGGAGGASSGSYGGGGGGGSSYADPGATGVTHTRGYRAGNGVVALSW